MATPRVAEPLEARHHAELATLDAELHALLTQESRSTWEIGKRLRRIVDARLYEAGGHATFNDYVENELGISLTGAHLLKSISRFPRAHVERFKWTKLALVLRLWKLLPAHYGTDPGDAGKSFADLDSNLMRDGTFMRHDATTVKERVLRVPAGRRRSRFS